jgi:hypothetical protein
MRYITYLNLSVLLGVFGCSKQINNSVIYEAIFNFLYITIAVLLVKNLYVVVASTFLYNVVCLAFMTYHIKSAGLITGGGNKVSK